MKKSILNLKGAQELTKNEQKNVSGGIDFGHLNGYEYGSDGCKCYDIIYRSRNEDGVFEYSTTYSSNSSAVGYAAIVPTPDCCL